MSRDVGERINREAVELARELRGNDEWVEYCDELVSQPWYNELCDALRKDGIRGIEPYISEVRVSALAKAKGGDLSELAELIRAGTVLNAEERKFAADLMSGQIKATNGRPKNQSSIQEVCLALFWLQEHEGWPTEAATSYCMEIFGLHRSQVFARKREGKRCVLTQELIGMRRLAVKFLPFEFVNYFKSIDLKSK